MNETDALARVHAMYDRCLPQASQSWNWLHAVEFIAHARSPLVESVLQMRAQGIVPTCKLIQILPGAQYKIIVTRVQLERIIAFHYGVEEHST